MSETDVNRVAGIERAAFALNELIRKAAGEGLRVEVRSCEVESIGLGDKLVRAPEVSVIVLRPIVTTGVRP